MAKTFPEVREPLFILQNWTKLNKSGGGPWPEERESHAAVCLNYGKQYPQLLVTGGRDRQAKPLADVWTLDIERGSWRKVRLEYTQLCKTYPNISGQLGKREDHVFLSWPPTHNLKCARIKIVNGEGLEPRLP